MLKRKLSAMIGIAAAVVLMTGCPFPGPDPDTKTSSIDYTNYSNGNNSLKVKNDSSKNVVCFMNTVSETNLISGAKAGQITGLKKTSAFGTDSFDFVLVAITEDAYEAGKAAGDFTEAQNSPLCRLYAYYNSDSESNSNLMYTISDKLGGDYYFILNNTTKYNCEIRKDGLYGTPMMYAGAQTLKTKVYAEEGSYDFYPVFRKFDKNAGAIITNYPKTAKGNPMYTNIGLGKGSGDDDQSAAVIDCENFFTEDFKITPSSAQLKINNQVKNTGVQLYKGTNAVASQTDTGMEVINSGKSATFNINMDSLGDGSYESQISIESWRVGPTAHKVDIPAQTFEAGYRYVLNVKGNSYDDFTAEFDTYASDAADGSYKAGDLVRYALNLDEE